MNRTLVFRDHVLQTYPDVYTPDALDALDALAPIEADRHASWLTESPDGSAARGTTGASTSSTG